MAVTTISSPAFPGSLYRPLQYTCGVTLPTAEDITFIRLATSGDVATYPTLIEGESIIVEHATYTGFDVGQHMLIEGAGEWNGVRKVREVLDSTHTVLDGAGYAEVTAGTIRIYRNNHKFIVYLWHDIAETTPRAVLKVDVSPVTGQATFSVNTVLQSWIQSDLLHSVVTANLSATEHISTEFLSSVIFRIQVLEGYDVPDDDGINVWTLDGEWDPETGTPRCAVNGVHPYDHIYADETNAQFDWTDPRMIDYVASADPVARFLTYAPRAGEQVMANAETGRLVVLLSSADDFDGTADFRIVLFGYDAAGTPTELGSSDVFTPAAGTSSFAIPCGPNEIETLVVPTFPLSGYVAYSILIAEGSVGGAVTEAVKFRIDNTCKEVRRRFHWMNKLGGIDSYSFTRRELASSKVKRLTLSKPYASGTGFDYRTRTYRTDPTRNFTVSSEQVKPIVRRWIAEDLVESANVLTSHGSPRLSTVIFTTDQVDSHSTEDRKSQLVLNYTIGVDNLSQES